MTDVQLKHVSFAYSDGLVIRDIDLTVRKGEVVGLIGPNGSGKTTLLKLISGVLQPTQGEINLDGLNLIHLKRKKVAQMIAMVPQQFNMPFAFYVEDVVALGRTPFLKMLSEGSKKELDIVTQAMEEAGIKSLAQRFFNELSGGERQKVILAMALAQQPKLLLLDEPTAHLDISHQIEILELARSLNKEKAITIISAIHDLNLASLYFNRLVLLNEGCIIADGTPDEVLTTELLQDVFSAPVLIQQHPQANVPYIIVLPNGNNSTLK
jgi:iron complex transport system ATP-binding protein